MSDEPVFADAWQAQAFAMVQALQQQGHLGPREWTDALSAEIEASSRRGERDDGSRYYDCWLDYDCWLAALEKLVVAKDFMNQAEMARRKQEWDEAARATPHGQPIVLKR
jgi:nitrile hydratase accessory protein